MWAGDGPAIQPSWSKPGRVLVALSDTLGTSVESHLTMTALKRYHEVATCCRLKRFWPNSVNMINLSQRVKVLALICSGNWAFLWMRFSEDVAKDGHTCCVKKRYKRGGVVWTRYRTNKRECWNASLCIILNCKASWFQILQNALNWLQVLLSASFQILYCTFHSFDMFQTFWRNPVESIREPNGKQLQ